jgi:hypothetical protein
VVVTFVNLASQMLTFAELIFLFTFCTGTLGW